MTDKKHEQPATGGSYIRGQDGSLKRVEQTAPAAPHFEHKAKAKAKAEATAGEPKPDTAAAEPASSTKGARKSA